MLSYMPVSPAGVYIMYRHKYWRELNLVVACMGPKLVTITILADIN